MMKPPTPISDLEFVTRLRELCDGTRLQGEQTQRRLGEDLALAESYVVRVSVRDLARLLTLAEQTTGVACVKCRRHPASAGALCSGCEDVRVRESVAWLHHDPDARK